MSDKSKYLKNKKSKTNLGPSASSNGKSKINLDPSAIPNRESNTNPDPSAQKMSSKSKYCKDKKANLHPSASSNGKSKTNPDPSQSSNGQSEKRKFPRYISKANAKLLVSEGKCCEGQLRINHKNYLDAFVNLMSGENNIYVEGVENRNAALDGDTVVVSLFEMELWKVSLVDAVEFLNADSDQLLAKEILSTHYPTLYEQWMKDIEVSTSKSSVNGCQLPNEIAAPVIPTCPTVAKWEDSMCKLLSDIKAIHIDVHEKVTAKCEKLEDCDITAGYQPVNAFADCVRNNSAYVEKLEKSGGNVNDLSMFTALQILVWKNALTVEILWSIPALQRYVQQSGEIVCIKVHSHLRKAAGQLQLFPEDCDPENSAYALFSPSDYRIPRMKIPLEECPSSLNDEKFNSQIIYIAKIVKWTDPKFAIGEIIEKVGSKYELTVQKDILLLENDVDDTSYSEKELRDIPTTKSILKSEEEIKSRRDLRNQCIFTIDPSTAKDLDDAVSCIPLENGNFEVGVHIADVTHYVEVDSDVDKKAAARSTTYYLTDKVIPMLPPKLSENLCSLDAGKDKLTFSIIWEMKPTGAKVKQWIGKTIINSCCKLSYDHAQAMIDNKCGDLLAADFPHIHGKRTLREIHVCVNNLNAIAVPLRQGRIDRGSLRLDQAKYGVLLHPITMTPTEICYYGLKDSNKLIEEFMLLANTAVARKIHKHFPHTSLLRQHSRPFRASLETTRAVLAANGVSLDVSSAGALSRSLEPYRGKDEKTAAVFLAIVHMCSKPMQQAKYFNSGDMANRADFHHYALNEPLYTHFTSPIRRYADIIVHRLLASAIDSRRFPLTKKSPFQRQSQASHANDRKKVAKTLQEDSAELHLAAYIREIKTLDEEGVVVGVLTRAVDVLLIRYSMVKRCYMKALTHVKHSFDQKIKPGTLHLTWGGRRPAHHEQTISLFSRVTVELKVDKENGKILATLKCPVRS